MPRKSQGHHSSKEGVQNGAPLSLAAPGYPGFYKKQKFSQGELNDESKNSDYKLDVDSKNNEYKLGKKNTKWLEGFNSDMNDMNSLIQNWDNFFKTKFPKDVPGIENIQEFLVSQVDLFLILFADSYKAFANNSNPTYRTSDKLDAQKPLKALHNLVRPWFDELQSTLNTEINFLKTNAGNLKLHALLIFCFSFMDKCAKLIQDDLGENKLPQAYLVDLELHLIEVAKDAYKLGKDKRIRYNEEVLRASNSHGIANPDIADNLIGNLLNNITKVPGPGFNLKNDL
ncbi:hypothetical protein Lqui_1277 [Legionella quinlivanii]|uniref:Uncharacterized protein n=1 Tax=Legionella quinlivanii TaxID=45073 RepID=A0A0W0XZR3_9GAMM|nr:hypothetical protein [Legionella quinlivanii]KTD49952.1 hypothetical protein Lqui_1277 [Legionella quinlivanii]SEF96833.1 hypothetical protein SAMN02746093_01521 [Legionella quinlivanii DSM 21216]STY11272.1 Uncharacterised protein [Legionella quinlivanii]